MSVIPLHRDVGEGVALTVEGAVTSYRLHDVGYALDLAHAARLLEAQSPARARPTRGEAKALGLVNHLVPAGQARDKALEIAATIAANGPVAIRQAKKAINWGSETDLDTGMALAIEAYNVTVTTDDRLEGVRAFNEKRKPNFKGK